MKASPNLDVLRATAVMCVVFYHALTWAGLYDLPALGRFGVVLFFVHTACVLMQSLERLESAGALGCRLVLSFGIRRVFRIYPLCMAVVLLIAAGHLPPSPIRPYEPITHVELASNILMIQHFTGARFPLNALWSLPVEVEMYCLLPFLYLAVRRWRWTLFLAFAASIVAAFHVIWHPGRSSIVIFAPCFLSGILAYRLWPRIGKLPALLFPLALLSLIAAFCWRSGDAMDVDTRMVRAWVCCVILAVAIAATRQLHGSWITTACGRIAKYSYGIYLSHPLVAYIALSSPLPPVGRWLVALGLGAAAPVLLYHLIEHPMIQVGARVAQRLTSGSVSEAQTARAAA